MSSSPSLRKSLISEAVEQIRGVSVSVPAFRETITAPAGAQASEIQPMIVETPPLDLSQLPDDLMAGVQTGIPTEFDRSVATAAHRIENGPPLTIEELETRILNEGQPIPAHWSKGALLKVRNRGDHYCITLYPEEFDPRHPERAMMFPNTWECQDFVSKWYCGETANPLAR